MHFSCSQEASFPPCVHSVISGFTAEIMAMKLELWSLKFSWIQIPFFISDFLQFLHFLSNSHSWYLPSFQIQYPDKHNHSESCSSDSGRSNCRWNLFRAPAFFNKIIVLWQQNVARLRKWYLILYKYFFQPLVNVGKFWCYKITAVHSTINTQHFTNCDDILSLSFFKMLLIQAALSAQGWHWMWC